MDPLVSPSGPRAATAPELVQLVIAYAGLLTAAWEARSTGRLPSDEPVTVAALAGQGAPACVVLWLLFQGHVEHLGGAAPSPAGGAVLGGDSRLALTPAGEAFADSWLLLALCADSAEGVEQAWAVLRLGELLPRYERRPRLFCWGRHELKRFRQPAGNQELILLAAEELGWPDWFDDPLPRRGGSPKVSLHDTIKDLNRRQRLPLVHFKGDGTGTRAGWELR